MKRNLFWCIGLIFCTLMAGVAGAEVLNPSFEDGNNTEPWDSNVFTYSPDHWYFGVDGDGWAIWGKEGELKYPASTGKKEYFGPANTGEKFIGLGVWQVEGSWAVAYQELPASPGQSYMLSAYVRNGWPDNNPAARDGWLKIEFYDDANNLLNDPPEYSWAPAYEDWTQTAMVATAPEGTTKVRPVLVAATLYMEICYDDVSFQEVVEPNNVPAEKVLEWKLDDASGIIAEDSTANDNDGQLVGGATWTGGVIDGALAFDGIDGEVNSPLDLTNLPIDFNDHWSMNVFVYIDESIFDDEHMRICGFGTDAWSPAGVNDPCDPNYWCYVGYGRSIGNHGGIAFLSDGIRPITTGVPYSIGRWQMITVTYDPDMVWKHLIIYKNGVQIGHGTPDRVYESGGFADTEPRAQLAFINDFGGDGAAESRFAGKIDQFSIWNSVLTPQEIQSMVVYMPKEPPEKVVEWLLNENTGTTAQDSTANDNDGEFFDNDDTYMVSPQWEPGVSGSAVFFDIYNKDYIETPDMNTTVNIPTAADDSWSMNVYVYMDYDINDWLEMEGTRVCGFGTDSWNAQGADDTDPNDPGRGVKMGRGRSILNFNGNKISFGTEGTYYVISGESWDIDQWQMVTAVYDADLIGFDDPLRLYKNGELITTGDPTGVYYTGRLREADSLANVGKRPNYGGEVSPTIEYDFEGTIDEFTVWRGALSQKQISELLYGSVGTVLLGDLDYDDDIDGLDLEILADAWLSTEAIADIHGVGIVNSIDFAIQADNWLAGTP